MAYLDQFREWMSNLGQPPDVEAPGTEEWYTQGLPGPGQGEFNVEDMIVGGEQVPQQPQAGIPPRPPNYDVVLEQELDKIGDVTDTFHEDEKIREILDRVQTFGQWARHPAKMALSKVAEKVTGVDAAGAVRRGGRQIRRSFTEFLNMLNEVNDELTLEEYDADPNFKDALRNP